MFVVRELLVGVAVTAFRELFLLLVAPDVADGFEGVAGAAPGALRFFDGC